jgi:NAD-dependent DNA ligase
LSISQSILEIENYKLSSLAKHFNIKQVDYHNSLEDDYVCGKVFYELFDQYKELKVSSKSQTSSSSSIKNNYGQYLSRLSNQKIISNPFIWKSSDSLSGKTFVVSGVFEQFSRDDLKKAIEDNGGKVGSSISAKTDYVVAGANMGPAKLEKAVKLNIPIISENDFMKMINEGE